MLFLETKMLEKVWFATTEKKQKNYTSTLFVLNRLQYWRINVNITLNNFNYNFLRLLSSNQYHLTLFKFLKGIQFVVQTNQISWIGQIWLFNTGQIPKYFPLILFTQIICGSLIYLKIRFLYYTKQSSQENFFPFEPGSARNQMLTFK